MKFNQRFNLALLRRRVSKTLFLRLLLVLMFSVTVAGITLLPTVARRLRGSISAAPTSVANGEKASEGAKKAASDSSPTLPDLFALQPVKVGVKKGLSTIAASTDGASQDDDADLPEGKRVSINKDLYERLRAEHIGLLRGIDPVNPLALNSVVRTTAIQQMEAQEQRQQFDLLRRTLSQGFVPDVASSTWTSIGPAPIANGQAQGGLLSAVTGRATAVVVDPTNSNKVYLATAQGGVWRSTDGGATWTAIFDSAQSLAVGALALAPSNPSILYVGTGEGNNSADSFFGVGVYRIDNVDTTPVLVGPINPSITTGTTTALTYNCFNGRSISKILVHPTDPATIFVSTATGVGGTGGNALSNTIPPIALRGVFRSSNATAAAGAVTFQKIIVNTDGSLDNPGTGNTSIFDMVLEPGSADNLLVSTSGAATGGAIYRSTNAQAATPAFTQTLFPGFNGLTMKLAINKVGSTVTCYVSSNEPSSVAACSSAGNAGRVRKSVDGGQTWSAPLAAAEGYCGGQCSYDNPIGVDPNDANIVYLGGNARGTCSDVLKRSSDGGTTFNRDDTGLHADSHNIFIDPLTSPSTVWFANDGGIWKRQDAAAGTAWLDQNNGTLTTIQFQSIAVHPTDRNFTIGGTQDNGTEAQRNSPGSWLSAEGGDGGFALIDQGAADTTNVTMYHTFFNQTNNLIGFDRTNLATCLDTKNSWESRGAGFGTDATPSCDGTAFAATNGINIADTVQFYAPMALGPGTPNTLYFGTNKLYRSTDKGDTMVIVSQGPLSGTNPVTAIGISPQDDNVRIVGTKDGKVFATTTGSTTLTNTAFPIPTNATASATNKYVARAVIDPTNSNTAYVTLAYYTNPSTAGQVWRTTNLNGAPPTWTSISNGLPNIPINAFAVDTNDSTHPGVSVLYAGTDIGVFTSTDAGANWSPFGTGLPRVAVFDMAIQPTSHILRIATHGRGMWEILLPGSPLFAPSITSADNTTFIVGSAGTFTVVATGNPTPTISESGVLPSGVTFNTATNVLSGTPAAGSNGIYTIIFTAASGVTPDATQTFTLTVNPADVCNSQSTMVSPNASGTAQVLPGGCSINGVSGNLHHSVTAPGNATVYAATYTDNPTGTAIFDVGGGFVDFKVLNSASGDTVDAIFYYPTTITGADETNLKLFFFNVDHWQAVKGSAGVNPTKDITDNQNATTSGGTFSLTFDATSTPQISQLTGTVFTFSTVASPTAVNFDSATVNQVGNSAVVEWRTGFEINNLGFNVYRQINGQRVKINPSLIAGSALMLGNDVRLESGYTYNWQDDVVDRTASYWLEDIDLNGRSTWHGPFGISSSSTTKITRTRSPLLNNLSSASRLANSVIQREYPAQGGNPTVKESASSFGGVQAITNGRTPTRSSAMTASLQKQWQIASQSAIKIAINKTGWYKVNAIDLITAGLNPNNSPTGLQMFVGGVEIPIRVNSADGLHFASTDSIEFYGVGLDTTTSDTQVYWLTSGLGAGKRINVHQSQGSGNSNGPDSFQYTVERKEKSLYFSSLRNGDAENWFGPVVATNPVSQSISVHNHDANTVGQAQIELALQGVTTNAHQVTVSLNGQAINTTTFGGMEHHVLKLSVPESSLIEGNNQITFAAQGSGDVSLIDYVRITYAHTYAADNNSLFASASGIQPIKVTGFTSNQIRAIDVASTSQPIELVGTIDGDVGSYSISVDGAKRRNLIVFTPDKVLQPLSVTANQPATISNASNGADFVIITNKDFASSVQPLADLRQSQGYRVSVVDIDSIYDEFSYGVHSPQAVKDFLYWTYTRWDIQPKFVMFAGSGTLDPRNYTGVGLLDFVPTKLIDTGSMETASDDWFVDFNNDGKPQMSIGRLPINTVAEASLVVNKIITYEHSEGVQAMVLVSDLSDGTNFGSMNGQIRQIVPSNLSVVNIIRNQIGSDARGVLLDNLNRGSRIFNYAGHGSVNLWRGGLLTASDMPGLANHKTSPLVVIMTCLNGYFQDPKLASLGGSLLKVDNGGAVSVWASSGMTDSENQTVMNQEFFRQLFGSRTITLGEAIKAAKSATDDNDIRKTWILFGDPTMRIKQQP